MSATVIGDDELGAPFAQLFSPFKPGAKEATGTEITPAHLASQDPENDDHSLWHKSYNRFWADHGYVCADTKHPPMQRFEKKALVKLALLAFGWPLALNHFYEGNVGNGLGALLLTFLAFISVVGILVWIFPYTSALFKAFREFEGSEE